MKQKYFDVYFIVGLFISIIASALASFLPSDVPYFYLLGGIIAIVIIVLFIIQIVFILSKFSYFEEKIFLMNKKFDKSFMEIDSLKETFKTSEELNKIRLDLKEVQTIVLNGKKK